MTALLRVGTKVRTTDRGARVHGRAPDKTEAIGVIRDHFRPFGRQSKDRTPPYYVTFETGEDAWYDASEVEPTRGARSSIKQHHAKKKSPAQLDREIAEVLSGRASSARHHATRQIGSDVWDVAMDAILEHDPKRAARLVQAIRAEHGVTVDATPEFSKAVREAPGNVRQAFFELLEGRAPTPLPLFYELVRRPSDAQIWFKATEELKKPGYKGLQVVWYASDRKPKKAKQSTVPRIDIDQGAYRQITEAALPPEVHERFYERR